MDGRISTSSFRENFATSEKVSKFKLQVKKIRVERMKLQVPASPQVSHMAGF